MVCAQWNLRWVSASSACWIRCKRNNGWCIFAFTRAIAYLTEEILAPAKELAEVVNRTRMTIDRFQLDQTCYCHSIWVYFCCRLRMNVIHLTLVGMERSAPAMEMKVKSMLGCSHFAADRFPLGYDCFFPNTWVCCDYRLRMNDPDPMQSELEQYLDCHHHVAQLLLLKIDWH